MQYVCEYISCTALTNITAGVYYSGAGINPARAFGPDVVNHSFPGYHWIYWIGPLLGSLLAAFFYYLLDAFDWRTANPGQDFDDLETQMISPDKTTDRPNVAHGTLHGKLAGANAKRDQDTSIPSLEGLNGMRPSKSTQDTQPE